MNGTCGKVDEAEEELVCVSKRVSVSTYGLLLLTLALLLFSFKFDICCSIERLMHSIDTRKIRSTLQELGALNIQ